jgi:hypothetical protein
MGRGLDELWRGVGSTSDDVVGVLPQLDGRARVTTLDGERESDRRAADATAADAGRKAAREVLRGGEAERAAGDDLDLGHEVEDREADRGTIVRLILYAFGI